MKKIACALLWCLLVPFEAAAEPAPVLVVAPGGEIRLEPSEAAVQVEAAFDGGALTPAGDTVTAPAAGDHWLAVASRDRAGNLSPIRWLRVRVDGAAPEVVLATRPAAVRDDAGRAWLPAGSEAQLRATDDLAGVAQVRLAVVDELTEAEGEEAAAALPPEGEVAVRGWALDRVGNRSTEAVLQLHVDPRPPEGEILVTGPFVPGPEGGLHGAVLAPVSRLEVELDDGGSGLASWLPWIDGNQAAPEALGEALSAGVHNVEVIALDRVGNKLRLGPFRFWVDVEGPEISWQVLSAGVEGGDGETWYRPPVEVAAEAGDHPAGVATLRASIDGAAFEALQGPISVDGERLYLAASDRVGNFAQEQATWRIDLEPPELELVSPAGEALAPGARLEVVRGEEIEVRIRDRGAGVERATYVWNNVNWPFEAPPQPLPERIVCSRAGQYVLKVEAGDRLGNVGSVRWQVVVRRPERAGR